MLKLDGLSRWVSRGSTSCIASVQCCDSPAMQAREMESHGWLVLDSMFACCSTAVNLRHDDPTRFPPPRRESASDRIGQVHMYRGTDT